jgi:hypothetical protein
MVTSPCQPCGVRLPLWNDNPDGTLRGLMQLRELRELPLRSIERRMTGYCSGLALLAGEQGRHLDGFRAMEMLNWVTLSENPKI